MPKNGYINRTVRNHPYMGTGTFGEHRIIMSEKLGRSLLPGEEVHHDDRNKRNNDPNNLILTTKTTHGNLHKGEKRKPYSEAHKKAISEAKKGKKQTPEQRQRTAEIMRAMNWDPSEMSRRAKLQRVSKQSSGA